MRFDRLVCQKNYNGTKFLPAPVIEPGCLDSWLSKKHDLSFVVHFRLNSMAAKPRTRKGKGQTIEEELSSQPEKVRLDKPAHLLRKGVKGTAHSK